MSIKLIDGDLNQLGKMSNFTLNVTELPDGLKEGLIEFLNSKANGQEIISADCQILIEGWLKND